MCLNMLVWRIPLWRGHVSKFTYLLFYIRFPLTIFYHSNGSVFVFCTWFHFAFNSSTIAATTPTYITCVQISVWVGWNSPFQCRNIWSRPLKLKATATASDQCVPCSKSWVWMTRIAWAWYILVAAALGMLGNFFIAPRNMRNFFETVSDIFRKWHCTAYSVILWSGNWCVLYCWITWHSKPQGNCKLHFKSRGKSEPHRSWWTCHMYKLSYACHKYSWRCVPLYKGRCRTCFLRPEDFALYAGIWAWGCGLHYEMFQATARGVARWWYGQCTWIPSWWFLMIVGDSCKISSFKQVWCAGTPFRCPYFFLLSTVMAHVLHIWNKLDAVCVQKAAVDRRDSSQDCIGYATISWFFVLFLGTSYALLMTLEWWAHVCANFI